MRGYPKPTIVPIPSSFLLLVALWSCAATSIHYEATAGPDRRAVVLVTASNFAFEPNALQAGKGVVLVLRVENVTGLSHNLTVDDPDGKELANVDLPAHKTVAVEVALERSGTYAMYCAKPFHSTMGMRGVIEVP